MAKVSRLEEIKDLRKVWPNEARDFTPWLSQEDNIALLSEAVGLDITVNETESPVGSFNVDIFASETGTDRKIIIENQLENTNHDHLGKLITYASGKSADVIIWLVKHAREEHRVAIEWLNNHTDGSIGFFLCEIKLFRIGTSDPAVKFEVIEEPYSLTMRNTTIHKNYYIDILDFINDYGGKSYQNPRLATTQARKKELEMIKNRASEVSKMMFEICNEFASLFNLTITNTVKKWLNFSGTVIRNYFWGQLKQQDSNSAISISIFAEQNHYRLALELDVRKSCAADYQAYKKYLELPVDTNIFKFYGKQNSSSNDWMILDLSQDEIKNRLDGSDNIEERVQLSYFVSRTNDTTSSDKTETEFYQQFYKGLNLLIPYYNHVMNSYNAKND